jgi:hypothetical protein
VCAAEDEHVDAALRHRMQVLLKRELDEGVILIAAFFDQRHQQRRGPKQQMVASVATMPISGTAFAPAASIAARAPGSTTPLMDIPGNSARIAGIASDVAVLHAMTKCFGCSLLRYTTICRTNPVTVSADFQP